VVTGVIRKPFEVADLGNVVRLCISGIEEATRQMEEPLKFPRRVASFRH